MASNDTSERTLEPPHNVHLARRLNVVKCRVDLYKIPPKCINFEPTATHLYVDTFKFTKKYRLNIPYPEGVTVNTDVEATFDSGVLKCDFPIVNDPNRPADHDEVVKAREEVKENRKNGIPITTELATAAKLAKTKTRESIQSNKTSTSKNPLSNKEKRQKQKAKRSLNQDEDGQQKQKRPKLQKDSKKNPKTFLDNTDDALQVADRINEKQEMEMQAKLDKDYAKLSIETQKRIERKQKQAKLRSMRKEEVEKAIENFPKQEKNKKSTTKVSFAN